MDELILIFDTETTGIPFWKEPSGLPKQPHIVQVAAELCNIDGEVVESMDVIVKPNGWIIPPGTIEVHGITQERALAEGIPEREALEMILNMRAKSSIRVAHNVTFDDRIIRIGLKRYFDEDGLGDDEQQSYLWKLGDKFCTMWNGRKALGMKKIPKLGELFESLFGDTIKIAHVASEDTANCRKCYFKLINGSFDEFIDGH